MDFKKHTKLVVVDLLKEFEITQVYRGFMDCCACGCQGNYVVVTNKNRHFKRLQIPTDEIIITKTMVSKIAKPQTNGCLGMDKELCVEMIKSFRGYDENQRPWGYRFYLKQKSK